MKTERLVYMPGDIWESTGLNMPMSMTEEEVNRHPEEEVSSISGGRTKSLEVECGAFTPDGRFLVLGGNLNGIKNTKN